MAKRDVGNDEDKSVNFVIRMPSYRLKEIDAEAVERLHSRSGLMREAADVLLRIPRDEFLLLKRYAYREGLRLSRLVQEAVHEYVERNKAKIEKSLASSGSSTKTKTYERKEEE
jgi:hypothetical protein